MSKAPRHGVVVLFGYGIEVRVDRGHLIVADGIGGARLQARFPRVGHGLKRLVVIGADGVVSLAALRWLADQDAAFVMLDRDGSVLAATGPVRPADARLRRAQALANSSGVAARIARELIDRKLSAQQQVAREKLRDSTTAKAIADLRNALQAAHTVPAVRLIESRAAAAYWSAWHDLSITFAKNDLKRVPDHWRTFGTRKSPLTGSPRLAVNPPNAILNYLYTLLESEARLAAAALGLDPGLGVLHVDAPYRDSLACDLMEPVRPQVDAFLLDWIASAPLKREWFFEQRDGNCRLMASFAVKLSETVPMWRRAVAPLAEWFARTIWETTSRSARQPAPATRLTQRRRREAQGGASLPPDEPAPRPESICRLCGATIQPGRNYCGECAVPFATEKLAEAARSGRVAAQSAKAQARRADTQRRHAAAQQAWEASVKQYQIDEETYVQQIKPLLARSTRSAIATALGVSLAYAADVRRGRRRPHPRHWQTLARLVRITIGTTIR